MRTLSCIVIAAVAALPSAATAQPAPPSGSGASYFYAPPPSPISPGDMFSYCVYENRVYSLGSGLCLGRTAYACVPSPGPSTGNRAYWTSKDDPIFSRPACP